MNIHQIRLLYSEAADDTKKADLLYEYLNGSKTIQQDALMLAYRAGAEALRAKNSFFPFTKLEYISKAMETFKKAVALDKDCIEIRFLRFSIQHNTPFFLGMNGNLNEDKTLIIQNITHSTEDAILLKAIAKFLIESNRCTSQETKVLKDFIG